MNPVEMMSQLMPLSSQDGIEVLVRDKSYKTVHVGGAGILMGIICGLVASEEYEALMATKPGYQPGSVDFSQFDLLTLAIDGKIYGNKKLKGTMFEDAYLAKSLTDTEGLN